MSFIRKLVSQISCYDFMDINILVIEKFYTQLYELHQNLIKVLKLSRLLTNE